MSQPKNRRASRRADKNQAPEVQVIYKNQISTRTAAIIGGIVAVLILVIIGIFYYPTYIAPYQIDVIEIDSNVTIRMDYFIKRIKMAGTDPMSMLSVIVKEEILKIEAEKNGFNISDDIIEREVRNLAESGSGNMSDSEFKEWYRQKLNDTNLSDREYKDLVSTMIISNIIQQSLELSMPTTAEQIHAHVMLLETEKLAQSVKAKLDAGEDFAELAREYSMDATSRDDGGDLGWLPRGVINSQVEYSAWEMEAGTISDPILVYDTTDYTNVVPVGYYIIWVSEKDASREISEEFLPALKSKLLDEWYSGQLKNYSVKYHGLNNGFDSETYNWINWQVSKSTSSESTEE